MRLVLFSLTVCLATIATQAAENWPQFRGPTGDGVSHAASLPVEFGEGKNVVWKTPIKGKAWSSPVVWGDQIWVTNAPENGARLSAICLDAKSGDVLADVTVLEQESPPFCHNYNSYASPTPVIEEGRIYVHFGSMATACIDTKSFRVLWRRTDLECDHYRGPGSSPILDGDKLIVAYDGFDQQYVLAMNKQDGETLWRHDRVIDWPKGDNGDWRKAYSTAKVIEADGRRQLISPAAAVLESLDPETGKPLWFAKYGGMNAAGPAVFADGLLVVTNGHDGMIAVPPKGKGDISDDIAWFARKGVPKRPGPIVHNGLLFLLVDNGVLTCSDLKTNKKIYAERLDGEYDASPIIHDGKIYCFGKKGECPVVAASREFELLAENKLDDGFMASPAVYGDSLILRTRSAIYRIAD